MNGVQRYKPDYHPRYGVGMKQDDDGAYYAAAEADMRHRQATARLVAEVKELRADRDDLKDQLDRTEAAYTQLLASQSTKGSE